MSATTHSHTQPETVGTLQAPTREQLLAQGFAAILAGTVFLAPRAAVSDEAIAAWRAQSAWPTSAR